MTLRVGLEAADVAMVYPRKDPGDCLLIATARTRKLSIITRDRLMLDLAVKHPAYLSAIEC